MSVCEYKSVFMAGEAAVESMKGSWKTPSLFAHCQSSNPGP